MGRGAGEVVVLYEETDPILHIADEENPDRLGVILQNELAASAEDDGVALLGDLGEDFFQVDVVLLVVKVGVLRAHVALDEVAGDDPGDEPHQAAGLLLHGLDPIDRDVGLLGHLGQDDPIDELVAKFPGQAQGQGLAPGPVLTRDGDYCHEHTPSAGPNRFAEEWPVKSLIFRIVP